MARLPTTRNVHGREGRRRQRRADPETKRKRHPRIRSDAPKVSRRRGRNETRRAEANPSSSTPRARIVRQRWTWTDRVHAHHTFAPSLLHLRPRRRAHVCAAGGSLRTRRDLARVADDARSLGTDSSCFERQCGAMRFGKRHATRDGGGSAPGSAVYLHATRKDRRCGGRTCDDGKRKEAARRDRRRPLPRRKAFLAAADRRGTHPRRNQRSGMETRRCEATKARKGGEGTKPRNGPY